jgi:putative phage-type endonuclease
MKQNFRSNAEPLQRTKEWFKQREGRVTASAIGAIMGYNPFSSREDEMMRMLRKGKKFEGNVATEWGTFNEGGAIVEFEMETGLKVEEAYFVPWQDWMGASPDGYVGNGNLIEVKCPYSKRKGGEFKSIIEQKHYYAQIQMQLFCTGRDACYFFQWSPFLTKLELIERDEKFIKDMLIQARSFYDEYNVILKNERINLKKEIS